jgi:hypothetical protein
MAESKKKAQTVKVGDQVDLKGPNGLAVLPDGMVVTCRVRYTIQHEGRHVIDGVEYDAVKPEPEPAAADES